MEDLQLQKQALLNELQAARTNVQEVDTGIQVRFVKEGLEVSASQLIKSVILWGEGLFAGDSDAFHFARPANTVTVELKNPKRLEIQLTVTAFISETVGSAQFKAVDQTIELPKFLDFKEIVDCSPKGYVQFDFPLASQIPSWVGNKFGVNSIQNVYCFEDGGEKLKISVQGNRVSVFSDTFAVASDIVASLISFFEVRELYSNANFSHEFSMLSELMEKVEEFNTARTALTINMAENSQNVKALVVAAEDARIQKNMQHFRQTLGRLHQFNGQLLSEFQIRLNNHTELLQHLKSLNQYIQRAGNIRSGPVKNRVIAACKEAVKNREADTLIRIISTGN